MRRGQLLGSMSLPRTCEKIREGENPLNSSMPRTTRYQSRQARTDLISAFEGSIPSAPATEIFLASKARLENPVPSGREASPGAHFPNPRG